MIFFNEFMENVLSYKVAYVVLQSIIILHALVAEHAKNIFGLALSGGRFGLSKLASVS